MIRFACLFLILTSFCQSQQYQVWDFPEGTKYVSVRSIDDGIVAMEERTDVQAYGGHIPGWYVEAVVNAFIPKDDGTLRQYVLRPDTTYHSGQQMEYTAPVYTSDFTRLDDETVLAVLATAEVQYTDLGSWITNIPPMRLFVLHDTGLEVLAEIPGALNPSFHRTQSGDILMVWDERSIPDEPWEISSSDDAEIHVARVSASDGLQDAAVIGSGFRPHWIETTDGSRYLAYLHSVHRERNDRLDFTLRQVAPSIGQPAALDSMIRERLATGYADFPHNLQTCVNAQNGVSILLESDSLRFMHRSGNGQFTQYATRLGRGAQLALYGSEETPTVFWRRNDGAVVWSDMSMGVMFTVVDTVNGAAEHPHWSNQWTTQRWIDGNITLLHRSQDLHRSIIVRQNATSPTSNGTLLFTLPEDRTEIVSWLLKDDATLWLTQTDTTLDGTVRSALYRVTDLPLSASAAPVLPVQSAILGSFPSPTRGVTTLNYRAAHAGVVHLTLHDLLGKRCARLGDRIVHTGDQLLSLRLPDLPTGTYLLSAVTGTQRITRPLLIR
ncbi:T9SS type A sorting domain-containing protein [bacterium]|nr:T9SS type A sorting domain-containing protein [bacterium]